MYGQYLSFYSNLISLDYRCWMRIAGKSGNLPAVWWGLVIFFFCRVVQGYARIFVLYKNEGEDGKGNDSLAVT